MTPDRRICTQSLSFDARVMVANLNCDGFVRLRDRCGITLKTPMVGLVGCLFTDESEK